MTAVLTNTEITYLCTRVAEGDSKSLEQLYELCYLPLFRYCYTLTLHKEDAEDLTHQAIMKGIKNIATVKHTNVVAWFITIARNLYIDERRKAKKQVSLEEELDMDADQQSAFETVEIDMVTDVNESNVRKALATLPEQYREVLVLKYWHDMNAVDIARTVGKSHAGVRKLLSRAVQKMKLILQEA